MTESNSDELRKMAEAAHSEVAASPHAAILFKIGLVDVQRILIEALGKSHVLDDAHVLKPAFPNNPEFQMEFAHGELTIISCLCATLIGLGVLDAATPSPNDGCMTRNGTSTVMRPKSRAGKNVGCVSQLQETRARNMSE